MTVIEPTSPIPFASVEASLVADTSLAAEGEARIAWARSRMPVLGRLRAEFERDRPLAGRRIGMCLHVESKTAVLVETLLAGGAEVAWTGSPATTDDGVAAAMAARRGVRIYSAKADDMAAHRDHVARVLRSDPDLLLDNGADLIAGSVEDPVRTFEIGVVLATWRSSQDPTTVDWSEIRAMALRAEEIGFDTVWSPDELVGRLVKDGPVYGFWTVSRCPPRWRP